MIFKAVIDVLIKGEDYTQLMLTDEYEEFQPMEVVKSILLYLTILGFTEEHNI